MVSNTQYLTDIKANLDHPLKGKKKKKKKKKKKVLR
jgi:hypothetical protein